MDSATMPPSTTPPAGTPAAKRASSLRERILLALLGYVLLLTVVVIAQGFFAHERAEMLVWEAMLSSELDDAVAEVGAGAGGLDVEDRDRQITEGLDERERHCGETG